jgi:hypothetical protein
MSSLFRNEKNWLNMSSNAILNLGFQILCYVRILQFLWDDTGFFFFFLVWFGGCQDYYSEQILQMFLWFIVQISAIYSINSPLPFWFFVAVKCEWHVSVTSFSLLSASWLHSNHSQSSMFFFWVLQWHAGEFIASSYCLVMKICYSVHFK